MNRNRARHNGKKNRRANRGWWLALGALFGAAGIASIVLILTNRPVPDRESVAAFTPGPTLQTENIATAKPVPTPVPTPLPSPVPTTVPGSLPDVVSFYTPQDKSYSPRVRMGDTFSAKWKKGKDIGSFEVIASDDERIDGDFFADMFGAIWTRYSASSACKIGYTLRYTLNDGNEISYTMLSPAHIEHTEYIECWLYDDYHRKPHKSYSHLKPSTMKKDTLMTSIKLTAGKEIDRVTDIWLTAFICSSLDDFDAERNYIGPTSCQIHILRQ